MVLVMGRGEEVRLVGGIRIPSCKIQGSIVRAVHGIFCKGNRRKSRYQRSADGGGITSKERNLSRLCVWGEVHIFLRC